MGLPSRSFAADAHDCIMVWIRMESTEYKCVARCSAPDGELPSDHHPEALVTPRHNRQERPVDMWTIGFADRLRFPRFPSKLEKRGNARLRPHTHRHHSKRGKSIPMGILDAAPPAAQRGRRQNHLTPKAPYKPAPAKAGVRAPPRQRT